MKKKICKNKKIYINYRVLISNVLIILAIIFIFNTFNNDAIGKRQFVTKSYTINQNDTLWNIAIDICKNNDDLNIQNVISDIEKVNNMQNSNIYSGQEIKLPVYN